MTRKKSRKSYLAVLTYQAPAAADHPDPFVEEECEVCGPAEGRAWALARQRGLLEKGGYHVVAAELFNLGGEYSSTLIQVEELNRKGPGRVKKKRT